MKYFLFIFLFIFILFFDSDILSIKNLELCNRRIYSFNRGIDKIFLNPCTEVYITVFPNFLSSKIDNFFSNVCDIQNALLHLFFFKFKDLDKIFIKILINSTFGCLGFFKLSAVFDLNIKTTSFFNMSFFPFIFFKKYMILPIVGPGSTMHNFNLLIFQFLNPFFHMFNNLFFFYFLDLINKKSIVYFDTNFFHSNVLDGYSFLKDVYFQRFYISKF
ncbi:MAG TPA: MlaA family lipoprotein [Candidatus Azoamicus sp.]